MINNIRPEGFSHAYTNFTAQDGTTGHVADQASSTLSVSMLEEFIELEGARAREKYDDSKSLSKIEAQEFINKLVGMRFFRTLSRVNVLFVEFFKLGQILTKDAELNQLVLDQMQAPGKATKMLVKDKICEFLDGMHKLHRALQQCAPLNLGVMVIKNYVAELIIAQSIFAEVRLSHELLQAATSTVANPKTKALQLQLNSYIDVLHYLCYHKDFLMDNLQSISQYESIEETTFFYPPNKAHFEFYMDALNVCLFSLTHFQRMMQNTIFMPLKDAIEKLRSMDVCKSSSGVIKPLLDTLTKLMTNLQNFYHSISQPLQKLIVAAKIDKSCMQLEACFKNYQNPHVSHNLILKEMSALIAKVNEPWRSYKTSSLSMQHLEVHVLSWESFAGEFKNTRKEIKAAGLETGSRGELLKLLLNSIADNIFSKNLGGLYNAFFIEPMRMPMLAFQEIGCYGNQLEALIAATSSLQASLLRERNDVCSGICLFDLLWHDTESYLESLSPFSSAKVASYVKLTEEAFRQFSQVAIFSNMDKHETFAVFEQAIISFQQWAMASSEFMNEHAGSVTLQKTIEHLTTYFSYYASNDRSKLVILETFFTGLSLREQLLNCDLATLKTHFKMLSKGSCVNIILHSLGRVQTFAELQWQHSALESKAYWWLNFESCKLSQLEVSRLFSNLQHCNNQLQQCHTAEEALGYLHAWCSKHAKIVERFKFYVEQISLLGSDSNKLDIAIKRSLHENLTTPWERIYYLTLSMEDVLRANPLKVPVVKMKSTDSVDLVWDDEKTSTSEEEVAVKMATLPRPLLPESNIDNWEERELLECLSRKPLMRLNETECNASYFYRFSKRQELISNAHFYLTLTQEQAALSSLPQEQFKLFSSRGQADYLLLLEATEKIALCSLRIAISNQPDSHVACIDFEKRPLLYTHDGTQLVHYVNRAKRNWFQEPAVLAAIQAQAPFLKEVYWFRAGPPQLSDWAVVQAHCKAIWMDLCLHKAREKKSASPLHHAASLYGNCRRGLHTFQRQGKQIVPAAERNHFTPFQANLNDFFLAEQWDVTCSAVVKRNKHSMERLLPQLQVLQACSVAKLPPLCYTVRAIEACVSMLSMSLQLALSCFPCAGERHPLFLDEQAQTDGRPMHFSHRVDKLWNLLKPLLDGNAHAETISLIDEHLPHFVGDPRYPFPNKTALTETLICTHDKVYIYNKLLQNGFLSKSDKKLINRYIGDGGNIPISQQRELLKAQINADLRLQQHRISLALYLASLILRL